MKKFLVLAIAVICFASGCTKKYESVENYDSVEKYTSAMEEIKHKNDSYKIKGTCKMMDNMFNFTMHIKGKQWKTELKNNNAQFVYLYDGKNVYLFNNKFIVKNPLNNQADKHDTISGQNPVNLVFDWYMDDMNMAFAGNKKIGKFDCRQLVGKGEGITYDVCVNDKSGIAISTNFLQTNPEEARSLNINVTYIDNNDIKDDFFAPPKNLKEISAEVINRNK